MRPIVFVLVLLLLGCDAGSGGPAPDTGFEASKQAPPAAALMVADGGMARGGEAVADQKIIRNGQLSIEVLDLDASVAGARASVESHGGRIESSTRMGDDSVYMRVRVPAGGLDAVMAETSVLGRVLSRTVSESDVTTRYIDTEARLNTRLALRDRLAQLLESAESVEDILNIERELARVQGEIDAMQGQLDYLDRQVDESTLDLTLQTPAVTPPQTKPGPLGYVFLGVWKAVKWLFVWED